jgi:hypothetical protein
MIESTKPVGDKLDFFDIQLFAVIPTGQITSLGIGKETTYGVKATPTLFHESEAFTPNSKNTFMWRPGSRKSPGQRKPSTGGFDISIAFRPGTTPDTLAQLLAYTMGTQATPSLDLTSTVAYKQALTFGAITILPSFTMEFNRVTDALDYLGCCVDTAKFSLEPNKGLSADFTIVASTEALNASPTAPTFSTKDIFMMEAAGTATSFNSVVIGTPAAPPSVLKWDLTVANNIQKNYRGAQRGVLGFPLGARKVSGSLTLGFESNAAYLAFWSGTTAPGASVAGIPLSLTVGCQDYADPGSLLIPYSINFALPNIFIESAPVANKTSGALEQTVTFQAAETVAGGDDLTINLVNTNSTVY